MGEICKPHTDSGLACCESVLTLTRLHLQMYSLLSLDGWRPETFGSWHELLGLSHASIWEWGHTAFVMDKPFYKHPPTHTWRVTWSSNGPPSRQIRFHWRRWRRPNFENVVHRLTQMTVFSAAKCRHICQRLIGHISNISKLKILSLNKTQTSCRVYIFMNPESYLEKKTVLKKWLETQTFFGLFVFKNQ